MSDGQQRRDLLQVTALYTHTHTHTHTHKALHTNGTGNESGHFHSSSSYSSSSWAASPVSLLLPHTLLHSLLLHTGNNLTVTTAHRKSKWASSCRLTRISWDSSASSQKSARSRSLLPCIRSLLTLVWSTQVRVSREIPPCSWFSS